LKKVTFVRPTTDPVKNLELKKQAVSKAVEYKDLLTNTMYEKKKELALYRLKARAKWGQRLKNLNIDDTNIMITTTSDGVVLEEGESVKPTVFTEVKETSVKNKDGTITTTVIKGNTKTTSVTSKEGRVTKTTETLT
jgi:hypothetical protein